MASGAAARAAADIGVELLPLLEAAVAGVCGGSATAVPVMVEVDQAGARVCARGMRPKGLR